MGLGMGKPVKPGHVDPSPLHFHDHGIYALEGVRMTAAQIESARQALVKRIGRKKSSAMRLCVFPHIPVTKKPVGARMGGGKGSVDHFIAFVKAGKMIFEYSCDTGNARDICRSVAYKLPIKCGYVTRQTGPK